MYAFLFRIALVFALCAVCCESWNSEAIHRFSHEETSVSPIHLRRSVNVSVSSSELCVFDRLKIEWEAGPLTDLDSVAIAFVSTESRIGKVSSLQSMVLNGLDNAFSSAIDGMIRCDVNEVHCIPKVQSISAQPDKNRIVVLFEVATNQPLLTDVFAIQEAIIVRPAIMFPGAFAEWVAPDRLEIQVDSLDMQALLTAHSKGDLIEAIPRTTKLTPKKGSTVIRPAEPGSYEVIVVDRSKQMSQLHSSEANSHIVKVEACDDAVVLTNHHIESLEIRAGAMKSNRAVLSSSPLPVGPQRTLQIKGTAAVTGREPITFTDTTVDPKGGGTWSVSAWVRILESPTGKFRAVLHKGSSDGQTRTPSIWLMPDDNRLSVRVSTEKNPDIGAETISAIPANQWTFLSIVFTNNTKTSAADLAVTTEAADIANAVEGMLVTHPSTIPDRSVGSAVVQGSAGVQEDPAGPQYTVAVYINGVLDVKMDFSQVVLGNNHSTNFFKDISFIGPKALLSDFTLWDGALTSSEVEAMFLSNEGRVHRAPADEALDVLSSVESAIAFTAPGAPPSDTFSIAAADPAVSKQALGRNFADPQRIREDPMVPTLLQRAKASLEACEGFETRLDIYAEAAERGSAEALYRWAMLVKQGSEVSNTACGVSSGAEGESGQGASVMGSTASTLWGSSKASDTVGAFEHERAVQALLIAADMGYSTALLPLSFALLNGFGAEPLLRANSSISTAWNIPVHPEYVDAEGPSHHYRPIKLQRAITNYLLSSEHGCEGTDSSASDTSLESHASIARSVLRARHHNGSSSAAPDQQQRPKRKHCPDPTALAVGLLHVAAIHGVAEAHQALAYRYREGFGVPADVETAAFYHRLPSRVTAEEFHLIGAQSVVETDRIDDNTAPELSKGHQGNDDELIRHQKIRAQEGHLPSILAMADLYYYGARGLPRDHARALRYFEQAAHLGDESGLCGAAGMLLKGEGTDSNVTRAVELYENASSTGSIRALNGLGYLYFFGQSVPQNQTKAFHYFLAAALYETDADSLFNAAHCLEHGIGTERDVNRAVQFYTTAANKLGNFNSINVLANMYYEGRGVPRSAKNALMYYKTATSIGAWAGWLRRGFDQYLRGQYGRSVGAYLHAGELGYEVSQSNAAYILRTKLKAPTGSYTDTLALAPAASVAQTCDASLGPDHCSGAGDAPNSSATADSWGGAAEWRERLLARQYQLSAHHGNQESLLHLGTCYFKGACGLAQDHKRAMWYYSKASAQGHALSSAYLGVMYHFGLGAPVNLHRAERYYALAAAKETDKTILTMVQSLKYALSMKDFYFMMPVNLGLDYVVRTLWK